MPVAAFEILLGPRGNPICDLPKEVFKKSVFYYVSGLFPSCTLGYIELQQRNIAFTKHADVTSSINLILEV